MATMAAMAGAARVLRSAGRIEVAPAAGGYDSLVVFTHGLGDTAEGFSDVAEMFARQLQGVKFVLPTAPVQPVTLNGGMRMTSWYDITGLSDRASEECEGIVESSNILRKIMDDEHELGVPYDRMVLAGFSQGGALSLFTGLQQPPEKKCAGVLVLSGYLAASKKFTLSEAGKTTPTLHCHGTADPMVRFSWAEQTRDAIVQMGAENYELRPFEGLPHSVSGEELQVALDFIRKVLPNVPQKAAQDMSMRELKNAITRAGLGNKAVDLLEKKDYVDLLEKAQSEAGKREL